MLFQRGLNAAFALYDALVTNGRDNVLVAITGTNSDGVAVLDLNSLTPPDPLPFMPRLRFAPLVSGDGSGKLSPGSARRSQILLHRTSTGRH